MTETIHIDVTPDIDNLRAMFLAEWRRADGMLLAARRRFEEADELGVEEWRLLDLAEQRDRWARAAADAARMLLILHGIADPAD